MDKRACGEILKGNQPVVLWEGVFEFHYSENRGAAFGMLQEQQGFFFLIAVLVLAAIVFVLWRMPSAKKYRPSGRLPHGSWGRGSGKYD